MSIACNYHVIRSYQPEEMQSTVAVLCTLETLHDSGVLVEFLLLNGHVYSDDVLPNDTPGANVQMSAGEPAFIRKP